MLSKLGLCNIFVSRFGRYCVKITQPSTLRSIVPLAIFKLLTLMYWQYSQYSLNTNYFRCHVLKISKKQKTRSKHILSKLIFITRFPNPLKSWSAQGPTLFQTWLFQSRNLHFYPSHFDCLSYFNFSVFLSFPLWLSFPFQLFPFF